MKNGIIMLILALLLLAGCAAQDMPDATEEQIQYDWMAGESPVPVQRTGIASQGIYSVSNGFECTEDGVYFMLDTYQGYYLFYGDHGSDTIIKLCGRPDCGHSDEECNAFFDRGCNICYYDGYLYTVQRMKSSFGDYEVIRMNPDGSDQVSVVDTRGVSQEYSGSTFHMLWNGMFTIALTRVMEDGSTRADSYYYRLDGSMDSLEPSTLGMPYDNDGENFLTFSTSEDGTSGYAVWEPKTQEVKFLTEDFGIGYYGVEAAYYILDGVIYRHVYKTDQEEALADTGLDGYKALYCYPDCLVVSDSLSWDDYMAGQTLDTINLYFYNWNFDFLGQVELDYPRQDNYRNVICGETPERIILTDSSDLHPRYYVEKSDLGTGHIAIHEYNIPDLDADLQSLAEEYEDQEWLENG